MNTESHKGGKAEEEDRISLQVNFEMPAYQSQIRMRRIHADSSVWGLWILCLIALVVGILYFFSNATQPGMISLLTLFFSSHETTLLGQWMYMAGVLSMAAFLVGTLFAFSYLGVVPRRFAYPLIKIFFVIFVLTLNIPGFFLAGLLVLSYPKLLRVANTPLPNEALDRAKRTAAASKCAPVAPMTPGKALLMKIGGYALLIGGLLLTSAILWVLFSK